jgi:hypothetical protein
MKRSPEEPGRFIPFRQAWRVPAAFGLAAFALAFLPGLLGPYGTFIDEWYYAACARRLAWGYVDHPPLAPFVLRLAMAVGGEHLAVLRLISACLAALTVAGTGLLAWRLGAGRFGQGLAAASLLLAPIAQVVFGFYSMNAFEPLIWLALSWILVELAGGASPRWWLAFGAIVGLGAMTKHTIVTFLLAAGIAIVLTPGRRHLRTWWPWLGAGIAAVIVSPNLVWQATHGWPSIEFYRNAALDKNQPVGPLEVLMKQLLTVSPGTVPVWLAGLVWLLKRRSVDLRHLGLTFLILLGLLMASGQSRPDRILGIYPLLFAAGGMALGKAAASRRWVPWAAGAWLVSWGLALLPIGVPVLPPKPLAAYATAIGAAPQIERGVGKRTSLPQWFADRLGWEVLADDVAAVRDSLPEHERREVMVFAPSYGQAAAIEWLGRSRGLAPVYSTHNSYHTWGPPPRTPAVAIVIGEGTDRLDQLFGRVELARFHECGLCMPWRNHMPIWIVREPKVDLPALWPELKHYE